MKTQEAYQKLIVEEFEQAKRVLDDFSCEPENFKQIVDVARVIVDAFTQNKKVIACGNGGSHCDAMHFAEELTGRYRLNRAAFPAIAISDPSHISCVGNDYGYEFVFSRYVEGLGQPGDVLVGLSTSGTSISIVRAFEAARQKGMTTVLLSGKTSANLTALADYKLLVPHEGFADRIQEVHIKIIHTLIMTIEAMMAEQSL